MIKKAVVAILLLLLPTHALALTDEACLAESIYREARGEPFLGKIAVAQVVINRTKNPKFPDTICKVVFQPGQFTWTAQYYRPLADSESKTIARMVLDGTYHLDNFKAVYFVQKSLKLTWKVTRVRIIGNHSFYIEKS